MIRRGLPATLDAGTSSRDARMRMIVHVLRRIKIIPSPTHVVHAEGLMCPSKLHRLSIHNLAKKYTSHQRPPDPCMHPSLILPTRHSSDADSLQSSLLDMWNATFGKVNVDLNLPPSSAGARDGSNPGRTDQLVSWADAFSASLLRRLSTLSRRAEVKMPLGVLLPAGHDSDVAAAEAATEEARRGFGVSDDHSKEKESAEGDGEGGVGGKGEREISLQAAETAAVERCLSGAAAGRGHATAAAVRSGGVAGALPVEGARRSFIRQASGR